MYLLVSSDSCGLNLSCVEDVVCDSTTKLCTALVGNGQHFNAIIAKLGGRTNVENTEFALSTIMNAHTATSPLRTISAIWSTKYHDAYKKFSEKSVIVGDFTILDDSSEEITVWNSTTQERYDQPKNLSGFMADNTSARQTVFRSHTGKYYVLETAMNDDLEWIFHCVPEVTMPFITRIEKGKNYTELPLVSAAEIRLSEWIMDSFETDESDKYTVSGESDFISLYTEDEPKDFDTGYKEALTAAIQEIEERYNVFRRQISFVQRGLPWVWIFLRDQKVQGTADHKVLTARMEMIETEFPELFVDCSHAAMVRLLGRKKA